MKIFKVVLLLIVPAIVAFGLLILVENEMSSKIGDALYRSSDDLVYQRSDFDGVNLEKFFSDDYFKTSLPDVYFDYKNIKIGQYVAMSVVCVSLFYILFVAFIGKITKNNRKLLLWFFSIGLYITALLCILTVISNTYILIISVYYTEAFFIGRIHMRLLALLGLVTLVGLWIIIKAVLSALKKPESYIDGKSLKIDEYPHIWEFIKGIANKMNARVPDNIVVGISPTFYATEVKINMSDKYLDGETLFLSLSLARILTINEFESIIGHELAHFTSEDVKFTTKFYPVYVGAGNAVAMLEKNMESSAIRTVALLPASVMFDFFLSTFILSERTIGRTRELSADLLSAQAMKDPIASATGLVKVHAYIPIYDKVLESVWQDILQNKLLLNSNLSVSFMKESRNITREDAIKNLNNTVMVHPTDTHPSLQQRLDNLGVNFKDILDISLKLDIEKSAVTLIDNYESLENEFSKNIEDRMKYYKKINEL